MSAHNDKLPDLGSLYLNRDTASRLAPISAPRHKAVRFRICFMLSECYNAVHGRLDSPFRSS